MQALRKEDLFKSPGVAETLDWVTALTELDAVALDPATVSDTLGVLLKYQDDIARIEGSKAKEMLDEVRAELRAAAEAAAMLKRIRRPLCLLPPPLRGRGGEAGGPIQRR